MNAFKVSSPPQLTSENWFYDKSNPKDLSSVFQHKQKHYWQQITLNCEHQFGWKPIILFDKTINRKTIGLIELDKLNNVLDKETVLYLLQN